MRQRLTTLRPRSMARRPGEDGRLPLSPRARRLGGWVVALLLVLGIAAAVRLLGGNGDGADILPTPSSAGGTLHPITFGTALDNQRLVPAEAMTDRFVREDTFAYAVPDAEPASTVYVEVRRVAGGLAEVVQEPVDPQPIPGAPANIGFTVPAADLFNVFGSGTFAMRIYLDPEASPIAEGTFDLVEPLASPAGSP